MDYKISELPVREQPVNRLREVGPQSVSDAELLACVLGGEHALDQARALLVTFVDMSQLARAEDSQLRAAGLSARQTARLRAGLELGWRALRVPADRWQIKCPGDAGPELLAWLGNAEQGLFAVLYLDTRNRVLEREVLYRGTLNTSLARIGEVFRGAIRRNAAAIMVAHNHPSGDPAPSPEDVALTRRLVDAAQLVEVELIDHIVVGHGRYISLRERGMGFEGAQH